MLKGLLAAGTAAMLAVPVVAQPAGAPAAAPMQPGGWGQGGWQTNGWQQGGMAQPAPMPAAMRSPAWHGDHPRADRGGRLSGPLLDPGFTVTDWRRWGLTPPPAGARWVRYYDDAVLVDAGGQVIATRDGIDWDAAPAATATPAYGTTTVRTGPRTTVTTTVAPAPAPIVRYADAAYGDYDDGFDGGDGYGGATVSVTPGTITTTTTTTEIMDRGPSRARRGHRRCACRR